MQNWTQSSYTALFLLWILALGAASPLARAQGGGAVGARSIQVRGLNAVQIGRLRHDFPTLEQGNVRLADLDEVIRQLYLTGQFENVEILQSDTAHYILQAYPIRRVQDITVDASSLVTTPEIVDLLGLIKGEPLNRGRVQEGVENLKAKYNEAGFLGSQITVDFKNEADGYLVTVHIEEGPSSTISNFEFITGNAELENDLQRIAKHYLKRRFQQSVTNQFQEAVSEMFIDRRYLTTMLSLPELHYSADKSTVKIVYRIESPIRFVLLFEGNSALSNSDIFGEFQLAAHMGSAINISSDLQQKIEHAYLMHGYAKVNVQVDDRTDESSFVHRLTFSINEGARIKIKEIQFVGTFSRADLYYQKLLLEKAPSLVRSGYYSKEDLDKACQAMQTEIQKQGFLRAKIQNSRADFDAKQPIAHVVVSIEEGALTKVKDIQFKGTSVPAVTLLKQLTLVTGQPLSLTELDHSIEALKTYYANQGYLDMVLENEKEGLVQYARAGTEATLVFQVKEGPQVTVGSIAIDGLTRTKEEVVRIELEFKPGDILTPQRIQDTQYRLQKTGLFSSIDVYTLEAGTPLSERTVVVHVSETDPGIFSSGVGVSTEFNLTLRGFAGIAYNNLGGTARAVSLRGEVKKVTDLDFFDHRITAGYLEPYLFETRTKGRLNLTRERTIIARFGDDNIPAIDSTKFENNLEREFTRHYKLTYNLYGIQYIRNLNLAHNQEAVINDEIIGYTGPTFEMEYRDNPFLPKSGTYTRLNVEYSDPAFGSSNGINYIRSVGTFNFYVPFFEKKLVWANSIRGGIVQNMATSSNRYIPISRKFFLGGQSTIRGFDPDSIPTGDNDSDPRYAIGGASAIVVQQDSTFYLIKTELHFPLAGNLEGEVFYDEGAVRVSGYNFLPVDRSSVGLGLRVITPVGPANLEYGFKLNRQAFESAGRLDISIGTF